MKTALTIAGSDSGAGAGIQADLKTFAARGLYGTSAITAITAQNTRGVFAVQEISPDIVAAQIDAVMSDIGADAVKTGMLSSAPIIEAVSAKLREWKIDKLVVDPVMVAKSGDHLLQSDAVEALKVLLLPLALVLTPNRHEAAVLAGHPIQTLHDTERAARAIAQMGPRYVVIKDGSGVHEAATAAFDLMCHDDTIINYFAPRVDTRHTQGTGCTFSAAIAAELAQGAAVPDAVNAAKAYITAALQQAPGLGSGHGPLQHFPV